MGTRRLEAETWCLGQRVGAEACRQQAERCCAKMVREAARVGDQRKVGWGGLVHTVRA